MTTTLDSAPSTMTGTSETATPAESGGGAHRPAVRVLVAVLRFYRSAISPLRPPTCRYRPTCSEYALEAVLVHGAVRGSWLALRRLLRCHPFHAGGHDPVPPRVVTGGLRPDPTSTREPSGAARGSHRTTAAGEE